MSCPYHTSHALKPAASPASPAVVFLSYHISLSHTCNDSHVSLTSPSTSLPSHKKSKTPPSPAQAYSISHISIPLASDLIPALPAPLPPPSPISHLPGPPVSHAPMLPSPITHPMPSHHPPPPRVRIPQSRNPPQRPSSTKQTKTTKTTTPTQKNATRLPASNPSPSSPSQPSGRDPRPTPQHTVVPNPLSPRRWYGLVGGGDWGGLGMGKRGEVLVGG